MRYEVTNNTRGPRVLYNTEQRGVLVSVGETRVIDLVDHDAERLLKARGKDEVTLVALSPEPSRQATPTSSKK